MNTYLSFKASIGNNKPDTVLNNTDYCPFCDLINLKKTNNVLLEKGEKIFIENKYPVVKKSYPIVFIEDSSCDLNISNYPKEKLYDVISTFIDNWLELENSSQFKSVLAVKNHGPFSGASIKHSHCQLVGFYEHDCFADIKSSDFRGINIISNDSLVWNISTKPRSEFYEFNLILKKTSSFKLFCDYLQITTNYILNHLNTKYRSFNLAFYHYNGDIIVKVISRGPSSVFLLGYSLSQVPDNIKEISTDIQLKYNLT